MRVVFGHKMRGVRNMKASGRKAGFTLVELIVVIAIMGVLAAIIVPTAVHFVGEAKAEKAVAEVHTIVDNIFVNIPNIESGSVPGQVGDGVNGSTVKLVLQKYIGKAEAGTLVKGEIVDAVVGEYTQRVLRITAISSITDQNGEISYSRDYPLNAGVVYTPFTVRATESDWTVL